jgi:ribosomal protein L31E
MSSPGSKRFYWVKLQVATAMYRTKRRPKAISEVCRQLIDDSHCPKLVQIEAYVRTV